MMEELWTAEEEYRLRVLWEQGKTAEEISRFLVMRTRNAVCGKVRRMRKKWGVKKFASRPSPIGSFKKQKASAL